jgi:hypothetical protein
MENITGDGPTLQIWQQTGFAVEEHDGKPGWEMENRKDVIHQDQQGFASSTVTAGSEAGQAV